ncbi:MAG: polysaccharide biosynthesis/export family protein [Pseudomonadota bacterium]
MKLIQGTIALLLSGLMVACQGAPVNTSPEDGNIVSRRVVGEYKLGSADELRVTVFGEPELSGEYILDGTGSVSLPLIGEVVALNLTVRELETAIEGRYSDGYLRSPRVNIEVMNYRPFYILGEVREPGEYPYSSGLTVLNAVATAGGFTYRANDNVILIRGAEDEEEFRVRLDPSTQIMPGDTIRVIERFF